MLLSSLCWSMEEEEAAADGAQSGAGAGAGAELCGLRVLSQLGTPGERG